MDLIISGIQIKNLANEIKNIKNKDGKYKIILV